MSENRNPLEAAVDNAVEHAMDAFVFAPIGLLLDGPADFGDLVSNGKNQVTTARMMGQFTVQMGRTELEKRTRSLDGPLADVLRGLGLLEPPPGRPRRPQTRPPESGATAAKAAKATPATKRSTKQTAKARTAKKAGKARPAKKNARTSSARVGAPPVGSLPIPDYDSLSASQVVNRLRGLAADELEAVRLYESAQRARKTILNKVAQLQK